jgi:hypothetical protein
MCPGRWVAEATRDRNAIYEHLNAVYDLVAWWSGEGREFDRARRALRLHRLKVSDREDPFAAVIRWSRVMRYAAVYKPERLISSSSARAASTPVLLRSAGGLGEVEGFGSAGLSETLLRRFSVRRHQPETMFGVLVVESLAWYF